MEKAESWLYKTLHYRFKDSGLFTQALTHRSASARNSERLEFLGDAVLDLVISGAVFRARPGASEGDLSRLRSALVKEKSLAEIAADLGVGEYLLLGSGEKKTGGHRRESILADALESIFGAVYLDGGFNAASVMIEHVFAERLIDLPDADDLRDPKTRLQEWLQARGRSLPEYELVGVTGKAHKQVFEVSCSVGDEAGATRGESTTRRKAEQKAAAAMLTQLLEDSV
ncbi:MAG: ribonuclease III [Gammaproteobacteria bacterium]|nr:ribonuclease III [Gammaproteobacteria bacterium]MBU2677016.1 ribonuclease III [Gammaproteobacteria bacterium]NNC56439.1 ribonuclease III [Woeseiaceae bacterium]NNL50748.1 ribonuclease III [Woeseiaceae bacterium]